MKTMQVLTEEGIKTLRMQKVVVTVPTDKSVNSGELRHILRTYIRAQGKKHVKWEKGTSPDPETNKEGDVYFQFAEVTQVTKLQEDKNGEVRAGPEGADSGGSGNNGGED